MIENLYFKHRYGGIYQILNKCRLTSDGSNAIIYRHIWPFENDIWVRSAEEFYDGRFSHITDDQMRIEISGDQNADQDKVNSTKLRLKKIS